MTPLSTLTPLKRAATLPAGLLLELSFGLHDFAVVVVSAVISYTINLILLVSLVFSNVKILLKFVDLNYKNATFPLQRKESNHAKKKKKKKKSLQVAVEKRIYIESGVNRTLEKQ